MTFTLSLLLCFDTNNPDFENSLSHGMDETAVHKQDVNNTN
jgi:hypothetical protein